MKKNYSIASALALLLSASLTQAQNVVEITMPKVPEVPKVQAQVPQVHLITKDGKKQLSDNEKILHSLEKKEVTFSHQVAPDLAQKKTTLQKKKAQVGEVIHGRVAAYLNAPYTNTQQVVKKLSDAGFHVIKTFKLDDTGSLYSVVFTNMELIQAASKPQRGFAATLRVTVDKKDNLISITNPIYILKAFLQQDYDAKLATTTLAALRNAFKEAKNSKEMIKFSTLENFQFMQGMPKYQNMITLNKGNTQALLNKARKSKKLLFEQKLGNKAVLIGVQLTNKTSRFIQQTGYQHAGLLPYPILIEINEAKILDPKYYISVMYPMLKMSQFMKIAAIPDAITQECDKVFR